MVANMRRLDNRDAMNARTNKHRKARFKYRSTILCDRGMEMLRADYSTHINCPGIDKKHVREWNSGWVRAGVNSVIRNMKTDGVFLQRYGGQYPRLNWCWTNSRHYIAYNDVERPCSKYIYEEGWFLIRKMIDGEYRNLQLIHHGRVIVNTSIGRQHIIDLTYRDAIPVFVTRHHTDPETERRLLEETKAPTYCRKIEKTGKWVVSRKDAFLDRLEEMRDNGQLPGHLYGEARRAVGEALAYGRLPDRRHYQVSPWTDLEPLPKSEAHRRSHQLKVERRRSRNRAARKMRVRGRR